MTEIRTPVTVQLYAAEVGVDIEEIRRPATTGPGGRGDRYVRRVRQDIALHLQVDHQWPLTRIGRWMGQRHHTCVLDMVRAARKRQRPQIDPDAPSLRWVN